MPIAEKASRQNFGRRIRWEGICRVHFHRHARLKDFRVEDDRLDAPDDDAGAFDGCARLEAADVVEFRRNEVRLVTEGKAAEVCCLQRHKERSKEAEHNEEPDQNFK